MTLKRSIALLTTACAMNITLSQEYGDPALYLLDSLDLGILSPADRFVVDSALALYHQAETDTAKYEKLFIIVMDCYNEAVWPRYNDLLYAEAGRKLVDGSVLDASETRYYKNVQAQTLNNKAYEYLSLDNYASALMCYEQALEVNIELGNQENIGYNYNGIGYIHDLQGNVTLALDSYYRSLQIRERLDDRSGMATGYNNLGAVYDSQGDYERALENYFKSYDIRKEIDYTWGMAVNLNNIAKVYERQSKFDKAMVEYKRSYDLFEQLGVNKDLVTILGNIGRLHHRIGDDEQALANLLQSLDIAHEVDFKQGISDANRDIGQVYLDKGNPTRALGHAQTSVAFAQEIGHLTSERNATKLLYETHRALGNTSAELHAYRLYIELRDSVSNNENNQELIRQEFRFNYQQQAFADSLAFAKEQEVVGAQLRQERAQRYFLYGGSGLLLMLGLVVFRAYRRKNRDHKVISEQKRLVETEKNRSDKLLLNILPTKVADELKAKGSANARSFEQVSVLFTDFKGFTMVAEKLSPEELLKDLHVCFSAFDQIMKKHGIEKIKTIGDAYMAVGGLPVPNTTHAIDTVSAAVEIREFINRGKAEKIAKGQPYFEVRVGIHTGPVVAGIVGLHKFSYDVWGDTVNTAARMESSGEAGTINVSQPTYELVRDHFNCMHRGKIPAKNKGEIDMYYVV